MRIAKVASAALALSAISSACNSERKQDCDKLLAAMKPLEQGTPSADAVDHVASEVAALPLQDQPLRIYAKNYGATLTVLSSTLRLKASPSPPDGTDDVIKQHLKAARTDREDVQRYCSN
jgi:hypothetical protein